VESGESYKVREILTITKKKQEKEGSKAIGRVAERGGGAGSMVRLEGQRKKIDRGEQEVAYSGFREKNSTWQLKTDRKGTKQPIGTKKGQNNESCDMEDGMTGTVTHTGHREDARPRRPADTYKGTRVPPGQSQKKHRSPTWRTKTAESALRTGVNT